MLFIGTKMTDLFYEKKMLREYKANDNSGLIKEVLKNCKPVEGTASDKHLSRYALSGFKPFKDITGKNGMFHVEQMQYTEQRVDNDIHPCLVCIVRNNKYELTGLHCVYLKENGDLADVPSPIVFIRKEQPCHHNAIRLAPFKPGGLVLITIGLIQGLSVMRLSRHYWKEQVACIAMMDEVALMHYSPPKECIGVYIFVAHDMFIDQIRVAVHLKSRLMKEFGYANGSTPIYYPTDNIADFNDVLQDDPGSFNLMRPVL